MSAFLVTRAHMDRVVTALIDSDLCPFARTFANTLRRQLDADDIGRKLFALNGRAVRTRYAHHADMQQEGIAEAADYRWRPMFQPQAPRLDRLCTYAKALDCLAYQCSEDATIDDPLLAELRQFQTSLAFAIVTELPQYEAVPWGFDEAA